MNKELLDDIDKAILRELLQDGKKSARDIAKKLKRSPTTITNRINKLQNENLIKDFTITLNSEKLGFEWTVIVEIIVSKGKLVETEDEISTWENVLACYDVTGSTDIIVIAKFVDRNQLSIFTKKLLAMEYVERTNSHIVLNIVKEDFGFKEQLNILDLTKEENMNEKNLPLEGEF